LQLYPPTPTKTMWTFQLAIAVIIALTILDI